MPKPDHITIFDTHNFKLSVCEDVEAPTYTLTFKDCRESLLVGGSHAQEFVDHLNEAASRIGPSATTDDVLGAVWGIYVPLTVWEKGHVQGR